MPKFVNLLNSRGRSFFGKRSLLQFRPLGTPISIDYTQITVKKRIIHHFSKIRSGFPKFSRKKTFPNMCQKMFYLYLYRWSTSRAHSPNTEYNFSTESHSVIELLAALAICVLCTIVYTGYIGATCQTPHLASVYGWAHCTLYGTLCTELHNSVHYNVHNTPTSHVGVHYTTHSPPQRLIRYIMSTSPYTI